MALADGRQIAEWVMAARRGDRAAFEHLVRQFQDAVAAVVLARLGPGPDVEDVAQDAFLAAYRQLDGFADPARFGPWVCGIARNLSLRWLRDRRRSVALPRDLAAPSAAEGPELADRVLESVRRLPQRLAEPLTLFYIDGYTADEVASLLDLPPGTVRRRLHEARNCLRQYVENTMADEIKREAPKAGFPERVFRSFVVQEEGSSQRSPCGIVSLSSTDPSFTEARAQEQWEQIKALIAKGEFRLLEVRQQEDCGEIFLYEFVLSDGQCICFGTDRPLQRGQCLPPAPRKGKPPAGT